MKQYIALYILLLATAMQLHGQENIAPIMHNSVLPQFSQGQKPSPYLKTTALSLPLFEDFTGYSPFPDSNLWVERQVYVNNTMGIDPVSRGVATFDALNAEGFPYNQTNSLTLINADSLTSKPIDLSSNTPADSIYLSFFYQAQGNGFSPEPSDSLMLYLRRKNGSWAKTWSVPGMQVHAFRQVMVPIRDTNFFYDQFQFRFVNKATINTNDDIWNVDYLKMSTFRNQYDTLINDLAISNEPSFLLGNYTSMPYHQYLANQGGELAPQHQASFRNNYNSIVPATLRYTATERVSGAFLASGGPSSLNVLPSEVKGLAFTGYNNTAPQQNKYDWVSFDTKYYLESLSQADPTTNDTVVKGQVFHNYFAYDDGTAEKSYYLSMFPTLPGRIAMEYNLNVPDTMTGMAIYFGKQVPMGVNKTFSIVVYDDIAVNGGTDKIIHQEDFIQPGYLNTNNYYYYRFSQPVPLPQGTFHIGTIQPAFGGSDSLYFGLDVNRIGDNHIYYSVFGVWEESTVAGAVMMRPIFGPIIPSAVSEITEPAFKWSVYPNPSAEVIAVSYDAPGTVGYEILDMQGKVLLHGVVAADDRITVSALTPGMYFIRLLHDGKRTAPKKLLKL